MDEQPFALWIEILGDVARIESIAATMSEGQRADLIAAILNASTPEARNRLVTWINDKYGVGAKVREAIEKFQSQLRRPKNP